MRLSTSVFCAIAILGLLGRPALADEPRHLRYDTRLDFSVIGVGGVWWISSELLKDQLVPEKCRWCYRAEDGKDLLNPIDNTVRRAFLWKQPDNAANVSNILGFFVQPTLAIGLTAVAAVDGNGRKGIPVDTLVIVEATVLAGDVNQLVKFAFARERPFVHFLPRAPNVVRALTATPSDDNLSFFSGHTTLAFSLAASAGTVASMRGYRLAPMVWSAGVLNAMAIGYLRIGADKHYFSDVMLGAFVGSAIGAGIPLLFHAPSSNDSNPNPPSASGQAIVGAPIHTVFSTSGAF